MTPGLLDPARRIFLPTLPADTQPFRPYPRIFRPLKRQHHARGRRCATADMEVRRITRGEAWGGDGTCAKGITCHPRCPPQHAIEPMQLKKGFLALTNNGWLENFPRGVRSVGRIYIRSWARRMCTYLKMELGGRLPSSSVHNNDECDGLLREEDGVMHSEASGGNEVLRH